MTGKPDTAASRVPTEAHLLAELVAGPGGDGDLYDRLVTQEGRCRADELWRAACREADHNSAIDAELKRLLETIDDAVRVVAQAQQSLASLRTGVAWHVDYAEGQTGADLARCLDDAAYNLRIAQAWAARQAA